HLATVARSGFSVKKHSWLCVSVSHARSQRTQRELGEDFKTSPQMNANAHRWEDTKFTNYHELQCSGKPSATPRSLTSTSNRIQSGVALRLPPHSTRASHDCGPVWW